MSLASLKPQHLARYRDIVRLLIRHGLVDWGSVGRIDRTLVDEDDGATKGKPEQLADDLESLGPTFVKLGQLLSTRADLFPEAYLEALSRLQDDVEPVPFESIDRTIRDELALGTDEAFAEFEQAPIASASLGQVHRARLGDGRRVAVKVLRPHARKNVEKDLEALRAIAGLIDEHTDIGRRYSFGSMLDELQTTLLAELDYRREARNLARMVEVFSASKRIVVPRPVDALCTSRVLTMDLIEGTKIAEITALGRTDLDGRELAEELCDAYMEQMLLDGFFHADPHPGNLLLMSDGRLAVIDLGMVGRLSSRFRKQLLKLMIGVGEGDGEDVADVCLRLGRRLEDFRKVEFDRRVSRLVGRFSDAQSEQMPLGRFIFELARIAAECGVRPPAELAIVGKTCLHLDEVGALLDPRFDVNAAIRKHLTTIAGRHLLAGLNPRSAVATAYEMNEFVRELPRRINTVLEALTERELEVRVRAFDERRMMASLQRIGSRITLGLVFAALIVGASLVMRIDSAITILGYPALGVLLFLAGVVGSLILVLGIVLEDFRRRR